MFHKNANVKKRFEEELMQQILNYNQSVFRKRIRKLLQIQMTIYQVSIFLMILLVLGKICYGCSKLHNCKHPIQNMKKCNIFCLDNHNFAFRIEFLNSCKQFPYLSFYPISNHQQCWSDMSNPIIKIIIFISSIMKKKLIMCSFKSTLFLQKLTKLTCFYLLYSTILYFVLLFSTLL